MIKCDGSDIEFSGTSTEMQSELMLIILTSGEKLTGHQIKQVFDYLMKKKVWVRGILANCVFEFLKKNQEGSDEISKNITRQNTNQNR